MPKYSSVWNFIPRDFFLSSLRISCEASVICKLLSLINRNQKKVDPIICESNQSDNSSQSRRRNFYYIKSVNHYFVVGQVKFQERICVEATSRLSDRLLLVSLWELDVATFELSDVVKTFEEMGRVFSSVLFRKSLPSTPNLFARRNNSRMFSSSCSRDVLPFGRSPAIFIVFSAVFVAANIYRGRHTR